MAEAPSSELLVIAPSKPWRCAACTIQFEWGDFLTMDDGGPVCLDCADLGHLEFVPRGNTSLTRRARRASRLSAVVVQWSRARKRYERQGILAEPAAISRAEQECLIDSEVRDRRRQRDAERRRPRTSTSLRISPPRFAYSRLPAGSSAADRPHAKMSSGRIGRLSRPRA
jgi:hypothetical protein